MVKLSILPYSNQKSNKTILKRNRTKLVPPAIKTYCQAVVTKIVVLVQRHTLTHNRVSKLERNPTHTGAPKDEELESTKLKGN